jgi:hypothetical protein
METQKYTYYLTEHNDKDSQFFEIVDKLTEMMNLGKDFYVNLEIGDLEEIASNDPFLQTK